MSRRPALEHPVAVSTDQINAFSYEARVANHGIVMPDPILQAHAKLCGAEIFEAGKKMIDALWGVGMIPEPLRMKFFNEIIKPLDEVFVCGEVLNVRKRLREVFSAKMQEIRRVVEPIEGEESSPISKKHKAAWKAWHDSAEQERFFERMIFPLESLLEVIPEDQHADAYGVLAETIRNVREDWEIESDSLLIREHMDETLEGCLAMAAPASLIGVMSTGDEKYSCWNENTLQALIMFKEMLQVIPALEEAKGRNEREFLGVGNVFCHDLKDLVRVAARKNWPMGEAVTNLKPPEEYSSRGGFIKAMKAAQRGACKMITQVEQAQMAQGRHRRQQSQQIKLAESELIRAQDAFEEADAARLALEKGAETSPEALVAAATGVVRADDAELNEWVSQVEAADAVLQVAQRQLEAAQRKMAEAQGVSDYEAVVILGDRKETGNELKVWKKLRDRKTRVMEQSMKSLNRIDNARNILQEDPEEGSEALFDLMKVFLNDVFREPIRHFEMERIYDEFEIDLEQVQDFFYQFSLVEREGPSPQEVAAAKREEQALQQVQEMRRASRSRLFSEFWRMRKIGLPAGLLIGLATWGICGGGFSKGMDCLFGIEDEDDLDAEIAGQVREATPKFKQALVQHSAYLRYLLFIKSWDRLRLYHEDDPEGEGFYDQEIWSQKQIDYMIQYPGISGLTRNYLAMSYAVMETTPTPEGGLAVTSLTSTYDTEWDFAELDSVMAPVFETGSTRPFSDPIEDAFRKIGAEQGWNYQMLFFRSIFEEHCGRDYPSVEAKVLFKTPDGQVLDLSFQLHWEYDPRVDKDREGVRLVVSGPCWEHAPVQVDHLACDDICESYGEASQFWTNGQTIVSGNALDDVQFVEPSVESAD